MPTHESYTELENKHRNLQHEFNELRHRHQGLIAGIAYSGGRYDPLDDVSKMMQLFGQEVKSKPELPDQDVLLLRARLVFEEALEFVEACGCTIELQGENGDMHDDFKVIINEDKMPDLVAYADATADIKVVTYGADAAAGIPAYEVFAEVNRSNMSKVWPDGTIHKREDGKVIKPDTYSPADLKPILEAVNE